MTKIKLMPDYECYPLWIYVDDLLENIHPNTLPISQNLANLILQWDEIYQATYDKANPANSGFANLENEIAFKTYGEKLKLKLTQELGTNYHIELTL